jgi:ribosome-associated protein
VNVKVEKSNNPTSVNDDLHADNTLTGSSEADSFSDSNSIEYSLMLAKLAVTALENKKAEDIRVIEINQISSLGDYFILASGTNRNQIEALSDGVERELAKHGQKLRQIEGRNSANWVLLDYGDIIIHIFDKENRLFYNLERLWSDGKVIELGSRVNELRRSIDEIIVEIEGE